MEYEELYLFETGQPVNVNNDRLSNSNIIKNISFDQTEILHNIGLIYNSGSDQFDADMTASKLNFYNRGGAKQVQYSRA